MLTNRYQHSENISSRFSLNEETDASEFLENIEEICTLNLHA